MFSAAVKIQCQSSFQVGIATSERKTSLPVFKGCIHRLSNRHSVTLLARDKVTEGV